MQERKSAIVTGSATGVGAATALMLAQRGYDVLIKYSKSEREARDPKRRAAPRVPTRCCCKVTWPTTRRARPR
jgi:NAD(P)-dependent dehydrogenase (short-subunit alcohol dehydrogenase family)